MGMRFSEEYAYGDMNSQYGAKWMRDIEYYSDIDGADLKTDDMVLADGKLMSFEQFYKMYGIEQYPLVDEDKPCNNCLLTGIEWYVGIDKLYLCDDCFRKWMKENEFITDEEKIYEYYIED